MLICVKNCPIDLKKNNLCTDLFTFSTRLNAQFFCSFQTRAPCGQFSSFSGKSPQQWNHFYACVEFDHNYVTASNYESHGRMVRKRPSRGRHRACEAFQSSGCGSRIESFVHVTPKQLLPFCHRFGCVSIEKRVPKP